MDFEKLAEEQANSNKLLSKIVIISLAVIGIGSGLIWYFGDQANSKKAEAFYAKAEDACNQSYAVTCIKYLDSALALKSSPKYLELKYNALRHQEQSSEAYLVMQELLAQNQDHPQYNYLVGKHYFDQGETDKGMEYLDKAIKLSPKNGDYKIAKATHLVEAGKQADALPIYQELINKDPHFYHYWDQYALSYSNFEKPDEALKIRLEGVKQNPEDFMQYFGLAQLYDEMKKKDLAVATYLKSLELHPLENSIAASRIYELTGKRVPAALENLTSEVIKVQSAGKVMFAPANINGVNGRFLIDTGASFCVVPKNNMSKFNLKPYGQIVSLQTGNGMIQVPLAYGDVRIGKHDVHNVRVAIGPPMKGLAADGIIGMNVLEQFEFQIDRSAGTLTLRR